MGMRAGLDHGDGTRVGWHDIHRLPADGAKVAFYFGRMLARNRRRKVDLAGGHLSARAPMSNITSRSVHGYA